MVSSGTPFPPRVDEAYDPAKWGWSAQLGECHQVRVNSSTRLPVRVSIIMSARW